MDNKSNNFPDKLKNYMWPKNEKFKLKRGPNIINLRRRQLNSVAYALQARVKRR